MLLQRVVLLVGISSVARHPTLAKVCGQGKIGHDFMNKYPSCTL